MKRIKSIGQAFLFAVAIAPIGNYAHAGSDLEQKKTEIKKITVLPVENPTYFYTSNRNILADSLGGFGIQIALNRGKSEEFTNLMNSTRLTLGKKMTDALVEELTNAGYEISVFAGEKGPKEDPDFIEYEKMPVEDHVLHIFFDNVGMHSRRMSIYYLPLINLTARLVNPRTYNPETEEYVYVESLYYGAEADGEQYWSIPSDPKYKYDSFEALTANPNEVAESFDLGVKAIAKHIGKEFKKRF